MCSAQPEVIAAGFYLLMMVLSLSEAPYSRSRRARGRDADSRRARAGHRDAGHTRASCTALAHGFLVLVAGSVILGVLVPSEPISAAQVGRFTWLAIHPTVAGVFVSIAAVIGFMYVTIREPRPGPRWPWWVYAALLAVVVFGLVATRTRSAVLGAVVGLMACHVVLLPRTAASWSSSRCRCCSSRIVSLTSISAIEAYFARGESTEQLQTLNERTDLWSLAWEAIQLQPLYGYGVGASQGIFQEQIGLGGGHNAAVNVAVDLGLVGLVIWLGLVVTMLVGLLQTAAERERGACRGPIPDDRGSAHHPRQRHLLRRPRRRSECRRHVDVPDPRLVGATHGGLQSPAAAERGAPAATEPLSI